MGKVYSGSIFVLTSSQTILCPIFTQNVLFLLFVWQNYCIGSDLHISVEFFLHFTRVALTQKNQDNSKKKFANHCDVTEGVKSGLLKSLPWKNFSCEVNIILA